MSTLEGRSDRESQKGSADALIAEAERAVAASRAASGELGRRASQTVRQRGRFPESLTGLIPTRNRVPSCSHPAAAACGRSFGTPQSGTLFAFAESGFESLRSRVFAGISCARTGQGGCRARVPCEVTEPVLHSAPPFPTIVTGPSGRRESDDHDDRLHQPQTQLPRHALLFRPSRGLKSRSTQAPPGELSKFWLPTILAS